MQLQSINLASSRSDVKLPLVQVQGNAMAVVLPLPPHLLMQREVTYKAVLDRIKSQLDIKGKGISTGLARGQRWIEHIAAPGGRDGELDGKLAAPLVNGNLANAAAVSSAEAKKVHILILNLDMVLMFPVVFVASYKDHQGMPLTE